MTAAFAMHAMHAKLALQQAQQNQQSATNATANDNATMKNIPVVECSCGARSFANDRQRLHKRVAPIGGVAGVILLRALDNDANKKHLQHQNQNSLKHQNRFPRPEEQEQEISLRKRSLWRKLLGKGPKCICSTLQREQKPQLLQIPSDYSGCLTVRVAGKRVAYTRDMQLVKRRSYTPLDAISEDQDDEQAC